MLNGRELIEQGIVLGDVEEKQIQQIGVDMKVLKIERVLSGGAILKDRTVLPKYKSVEVLFNEEYQTNGWSLTPGAYAITVDLGCDIPAHIAMFIRQRSSLLRIGGILHSSVFDPGYQCKSRDEEEGENGIGTVMHIKEEIFIEYGARVAQIYANEVNAVAIKDMYGSEAKGSSFQGK